MWSAINNAAFFVLSKKFVVFSSVFMGLMALTIDPMIFSAAAVIVIGAIAAATVTIINALGNVKKDLMIKQAELLVQGSVIRGHVDGMTTAATARRAADEDTILALKQQLSESESRASLLAQSKVRPTESVAARAEGMAAGIEQERIRQEGKL